MEILLKHIKGINIATFNRRPFWIALVGGFAMAFFQNLNGVPSLFSPLADKQVVEAADIITPKLAKKENTIVLQKQLGLSPLEIEAKAYIVVDMDTNEILAEKNATTPTAIASLTKVLSAVIALDLADPSEQFVVSKKAASIPPTKIGVVPGEKMTLSELLQAMLLTSANDATEVIKEGIDAKYKDKIFIQAMNQKAKMIGMHNSQFTNPQGFDAKGHYSTPYDLALLSLYAMQHYPEIKEIAYKDYAFLPENAQHKQFDL
ncbi:MAG TPA: serine hydrolase, partial [Candidatus Levybacteria bacterium]|nr:serine hydrolase [Candidatus Levybacteria bacterium]